MLRLAKATGSLTGNETMEAAGTLGRMGQRDPFRMVAQPDSAWWNLEEPRRPRASTG